MIRMIGTRLILPKGDTGFFMLPIKGQVDKGDIAVFSVKNPLTRTTVIEKYLDAYGSHLLIQLEHEDTINLEAGKYYWDIKIYRSPKFDEDGILIDAMEIDSYYSVFEQPLLIIKEVAKNYV